MLQEANACLRERRWGPKNVPESPTLYVHHSLCKLFSFTQHSSGYWASIKKACPSSWSRTVSQIHFLVASLWTPGNLRAALCDPTPANHTQPYTIPMWSQQGRRIPDANNPLFHSQRDGEMVLPQLGQCLGNTLKSPSQVYLPSVFVSSHSPWVLDKFTWLQVSQLTG